MTLQILVPLHVYPKENSLNVTAHAAAVARHLSADVHAMIVDATFPRVSSLMGDVVMDVGGLVDEVVAQCRARGEALMRAMEDALKQHGVALDTTGTDGMMGLLNDEVMAAIVTLLGPVDGSSKP